MRVIATKMGFRPGGRVRAGTEFELPESELKKDAAGAPVLPTWVVEATPENRRKFENGTRVEAQRNRDAATAAAGPKRKNRGFAGSTPEDLV